VVGLSGDDERVAGNPGGNDASVVPGHVPDAGVAVPAKLDAAVTVPDAATGPATPEKAADAAPADAGVAADAKATKAPPRPRKAGPVARGTLFIHTNPWTKVRAGGRNLGTTPLYNISLPVGNHRLVMIDGEGNRHVRRARIQKNKATKLFFNLRATKKAP